MGDTSLARGCDNNCLANQLCQVVQNIHNNSPRCVELQNIFWQTVGGQ